MLRGIVARFGIIPGVLILTCAAAQPAYCQAHQPLVAVAQIDDLAKSGKAEALTAMILSAVAGTSKFRVVERSQVGTLLNEQALARRGVVSSRDNGRMGGFAGADYLIYGSITTFSARKKTDFGSTFLIGGLLKDKAGNGPACYAGEVSLSLDIKITEKATGQIRYVKRLDQTVKVGTICGDAVPEANASEMLRSAADKVATGLVIAVFPIKIADVSGDGTITLNYGEGAVKLGDTLAVFVPGKVIVDPDTGQPMGNSETLLGLIQITDVENRLSKAKQIAGFATPPEVRTIARPATQRDIDFFKPAKGSRRH